jgi:hypothetical protein
MRNPGVTDTDIRALFDRHYDLEGRVMVLEKCVSLLEKVPESVNALRITVDTLREVVSSLKTQVYVTWALQLIIITAIIGMAIEMFKRLPVP